MSRSKTSILAKSERSDASPILQGIETLRDRGRARESREGESDASPILQGIETHAFVDCVITFVAQSDASPIPQGIETQIGRARPVVERGCPTLPRFRRGLRPMIFVKAYQFEPFSVSDASPIPQGIETESLNSS